VLTIEERQSRKPRCDRYTEVRNVVLLITAGRFN